MEHVSARRVKRHQKSVTSEVIPSQELRAPCWAFPPVSITHRDNFTPCQVGIRLDKGVTAITSHHTVIKSNL